MGLLNSADSSDSSTLGYILGSLPSYLVKSAQRSNLVPKQVTVHGSHGTYTSTRYVSTEPDQHSSRRKKMTVGEKLDFVNTAVRRFSGRKTALGDTIVEVDTKHLLRRYAERGFSFEDLEDALFNPIHTQDGSSTRGGGSTEYWGRNWIVVVSYDRPDHSRRLPAGQCSIKTAYIIEHGKTHMRDKFLRQREQEA